MQFLSYLKYYFLSGNEHSIHSPFVYELYTKVIRVRESESGVRGGKRENLLRRLGNYFKPRCVLAVGENAMANGKLLTVGGARLISVGFDNIPLQATESPDIIFFGDEVHDDTAFEVFNAVLKYAHNDTMFLFSEINQRQSLWNNVKKSHAVTVTIDLFSLGLVFIRREQVKQHFLLRM